MARRSIDMISKLYYHVLLYKAETHLKDKLLLGADLPPLFDQGNLENTEFREMPSSTKAGYSFLRDPANDALHNKNTAQYILSYVFSTPAERFKFFDGNHPIPTAFEGWLTDAAYFVEILAVLIHISSGQPTRGTEITATTIYNNNKGGLRNLYWTHKCAMITQSYSKNSYRTGDQYIARFLPKALSYLLVTYLAVVRPFEKQVSHLFSS